MSFNQGTSSGSLSFRPAKFDVEWDGTSEAKASFSLACNEAGASYAAKAYRVFTSSGNARCVEGSGSPSHVWARGDRYYSLSGCDQVFASDISLPATVSSGVATIVFSSVTPTTQTYAWQLTATKGTSARVVIAGKITPIGLNPYKSASGNISLVSGTTAYGCI